METIKAQGDFTKTLWKQVEPIYLQILRHPFVVQLSEGTLSKNSFSQYLSQDILYLRDDNRALSILSKRSGNDEEKIFFKKLAEDGIAIEQSMQSEYLSYFDVKEALSKSEVITEYTDFLISSVKSAAYEVAATALLPCFWVYAMVGKEIRSRSAKNNIYQKWIDTYGDSEFESYVVLFINIVEKLSCKADDKIKNQMKEAFIRGTELELAFFEESYQK
jgi:thiaminase/transcriptional activator TenA